MITWRELRDRGVEQLRRAGNGDPASDVRWIGERASGRTSAEWTAGLGDPATAREADLFDAMLRRRAAGEPLQYVLGQWGFRTLDLLVDRRALIPRPETELVAEAAIERLKVLVRQGRPALAVDLGTGSGAIGLSIAAETWPRVQVWATDTSVEALELARANLAGLGRRASTVRLVAGDWFAALPEELRGRVDVVVSNPPYVAASDPLPAQVREWEPTAALVAGPTGVEAIDRIIHEARAWLAPGGWLVLEIGAGQGEQARALCAAAGLEDVTVRCDLAGIDRIVVAVSSPA